MLFPKLHILTILLVTLLTMESLQLPCDFLHSVNISDGERDASGGILHKGVYYKPINYALVDYGYDGDDRMIPVPWHTRGCVCQVMNCVWLCCEHDFVSYVGDYPTCSAFNGTSQLVVEMINATGGVELVDLNTNNEIFKAIWKISCKAYDAKSHEWSINSSGYVHSLGSFSILQNEYCLSPSSNHELSTLFFCATEEPRTQYTFLMTEVFRACPWLSEMQNNKFFSFLTDCKDLANAVIDPKIIGAAKIVPREYCDSPITCSLGLKCNLYQFRAITE